MSHMCVGTYRQMMSNWLTPLGGDAWPAKVERQLQGRAPDWVQALSHPLPGAPV